LIRRDGVETHRASIPPERAASLVSAHLHEIARGPDVPHISAALYDAIVRPIQPALRGVSTLVVVADAPYNRIAFSGLWDRSRNEYLVEHHALVAAPSATAYAWAVSRASLQARSPAGGAVIVQASSRTPTGEEDDPDSLAAVYPGAELRRGEAATPARLFVDVSEREVVHVSAPLVSNADFPSFSRLLLAEAANRKYSGAVLAQRVAEQSLSHARLVTLDVTAGRGPSGGEGVLGFVGALLVAGVPNVVGPVADLNVSRVERTWVEFHRHYAAGLSAHASLRAAQLSSLRASNRRLGPWATLAVFGSTR
jgi:CHAT domain-containing protein